jgi:hypothetical protein
VKCNAGVGGARGRAMGGGGGGALTGHGTGLGTKMWKDSSSLLGPSSISHSSLYDGERENEGGSERGSKVHKEGRREGGGAGGETEDWKRKFTSRLLTSHLGASSHCSSHYPADIASNNGGTSIDGGTSSHRSSRFAASSINVGDAPIMGVSAAGNGRGGGGGGLSEGMRVSGVGWSRTRSNVQEHAARSFHASTGVYKDGGSSIYGGSIYGGIELGSTRPSPRCSNHMMYKWLTDV